MCIEVESAGVLLFAHVKRFSDLPNAGCRFFDCTLQDRSIEDDEHCTLESEHCVMYNVQ